MAEEREYRIDFTDVTLNETDGVYEEVKRVMSHEPPFLTKWALRSTLTVTSDIGVGVMEVQCHEDGHIYVLEYEPSIGDVFYNPDLQVLSIWAQQNGWMVPQPHPDLVRNNKEFWKHFFDTLIIDSDYLEELYGKRNLIGEDDDKRKKK
jgi:hypothetical protein